MVMVMLIKLWNVEEQIEGTKQCEHSLDMRKYENNKRVERFADRVNSSSVSQ